MKKEMTEIQSENRKEKKITAVEIEKSMEQEMTEIESQKRTERRMTPVETEKSMEQERTEAEISHRTISVIVIFTLIGFVMGIRVAQTLDPQSTSDIVPLCNTSVTADVPLEVTVSNVSVTRQPSDRPIVMNATEDDPVPWPSTSHLTCEETFNQQQKNLKNCIKCQPVLEAVKVDKELNFNDVLLDKELLPPEVPVYRCPINGLCLGGIWCQPTKKRLTTYKLNYRDGQGVACTERDLEEHLECSCG